MDHNQAISTRAAERYFLDELSPGDRSAFEAHFFSCSECAADVMALSAVVEDATSILAEPHYEPQHERTRERWSRLRSVARLAVAASLVLVAGGAAYQSLVTVPRLRAELAQLQAPQAASWFFLAVTRSAATRAETTVEVPADQELIGLTLSRSDPRAFASYCVELRETGGARVFSSVVAGPGEGEEVQLVLPVARLVPGAYTLVLSGQPGAAAQIEPGATCSVEGSDSTSYPFTFTRTFPRKES